MRWIRLILELLSSFVHWRANASSPEKAWQQRHDQWAKELEVLQNAEKDAGDKYKRAAVGESAGNPDQLWNEWLSAGNATGRHRAREPERNIPGCE